MFESQEDVFLEDLCKASFPSRPPTMLIPLTLEASSLQAIAGDMINHMNLYKAFGLEINVMQKFTALRKVVCRTLMVDYYFSRLLATIDLEFHLSVRLGIAPQPLGFMGPNLWFITPSLLEHGVPLELFSCYIYVCGYGYAIFQDYSGGGGVTQYTETVL